MATVGALLGIEESRTLWAVWGTTQLHIGVYRSVRSGKWLVTFRSSSSDNPWTSLVNHPCLCFIAPISQNIMLPQSTVATALIFNWGVYHSLSAVHCRPLLIITIMTRPILCQHISIMTLTILCQHISIMAGPMPCQHISIMDGPIPCQHISIMAGPIPRQQIYIMTWPIPCQHTSIMSWPIPWWHTSIMTWPIPCQHTCTMTWPILW